MTTRITLRLKTSVHEQLKAISEYNKRSLNGQIEFIIENFIYNYYKHNEQYVFKDNQNK